MVGVAGGGVGFWPDTTVGLWPDTRSGGGGGGGGVLSDSGPKRRPGGVLLVSGPIRRAGGGEYDRVSGARDIVQ